jgi:pimeloyl-ACP methyl ester carboxylesterase
MSDTKPRSGYAPVNGLRLYYEISGAGEPLVLLHGGLGMTGMFGELLPRLAEGRQVIAVDLQGHGRTADIDRPLRQDYDWSAEVAAIRTPTLLVYGDADSVPPAHMAEFFMLLGGGKGDAGWDSSRMPASRLAILPGTTHYNSFSSPLLADVVVPFLEATLPVAS